MLCHVWPEAAGKMGGKSPDVCAYLGCSACHAVEEHPSSAPRHVLEHFGVYWPSVLRAMVLDAVLRTLEIWVEEGLLKF